MKTIKYLWNRLSELSPNQEKNLNRLVNTISLAIILSAFGVCIYMYLVNRSLWVDEAMLAYSLSLRSMTDLTSRMLDNVQSAPIIYLYIVKLITLVFGNSEASLRVFSFISYLLVLYFSFYISKNLLKIKYPILPVVFTATMWIMMRYINEFKPYMTDAMAVLLTLIIYDLYRKETIKQSLFILSLAIFIWFSNPVCFMIGAILIYDLIEALRDKNKKQLKNTLIVGLVVLFSFLVYYFYWLKPLIDTGLMQRFWGLKNFPLIPTNSFEVYHFKYLLSDILKFFRQFWFMIAFTIFIGGPLNFFWIKNRYINIINLTLLISFTVSWMGMFPIQDRMCLFFYPLFALLFFFYFSQLFTRKVLINILLLIFSFIVMSPFTGILYFSKKENIYNQEMNKAVDFLEDKIETNDALYIPVGEEACQYLYKKKYKTDDLHYQVMFGYHYWWAEEILHEGDMEKLIDFTKRGTLYVLMKYDRDFILLDSLFNYGNIEQIYDKYDKKIYKITPKL